MELNAKEAVVKKELEHLLVRHSLTEGIRYFDMHHNMVLKLRETESLCKLSCSVNIVKLVLCMLTLFFRGWGSGKVLKKRTVVFGGSFI